jgi:ferritin
MNKINKNMQDAFNKQINAEIFSSYLYLAMAAFLAENNFNGMSIWMKKQVAEELEHAMKLFDYVHKREGKVILTPIQSSTTEYKSPLDVFEKTYNHECNVTKLIIELVDLSIKETDNDSKEFLKWFVEEQKEEEESTLEIFDSLKKIKNDADGLLVLDTTLGKRN